MFNVKKKTSKVNLQRSAKPFIAAKCNAVQPTLDLLFMNALCVSKASHTYIMNIFIVNNIYIYI